MAKPLGAKCDCDQQTKVIKQKLYCQIIPQHGTPFPRIEKIFLVQIRLRREVLRNPNSIQPGFELTTFRVAGNTVIRDVTSLYFCNRIFDPLKTF